MDQFPQQIDCNVLSERLVIASQVAIGLQFHSENSSACQSPISTSTSHIFFISLDVPRLVASSPEETSNTWPWLLSPSLNWHMPLTSPFTVFKVLQHCRFLRKVGAVSQSAVPAALAIDSITRCLCGWAHVAPTPLSVCSIFSLSISYYLHIRWAYFET